MRTRLWVSYHVNVQGQIFAASIAAEIEAVAQRSLRRLQQLQISFAEPVSDSSTEVLGKICDNIDLDDLPSFRLVGKKYANVGAQSMFEEVHLTYCPLLSFAKFQAVSEDHNLRQPVRSILYQGDWLPNVTDQRLLRAKPPTIHAVLSSIVGIWID